MRHDESEAMWDCRREAYGKNSTLAPVEQVAGSCMLRIVALHPR